MRLLKSILAGLFVLMVGLFTALVIAVSAVVIFIGAKLRGGRIGDRTTCSSAGMRRKPANDEGVIDVDATEVPTTLGR
jgi:hypothetical protein